MTAFNTKAITVANLSTILGGMTSTNLILNMNNLQVTDTKGNRVGTIDIAAQKYIPLTQAPISTDLKS